MKKIFAVISLLGALLSSTITANSKDYTVKSPSGSLSITVSAAQDLTWAFAVDEATLSSGNRIAMQMADGTVLGPAAKVLKTTRSNVRETIPSPFYRQGSIQADYNGVTLTMKGGWALEIRAYDEGVAYRFRTAFKDSLTVRDEIFEYHYDSDLVIPFARRKDDIYETAFESRYTFFKQGDAPNTEQFAFLPILASAQNAPGKVLLMESDVEQYPGMFIVQGENLLSAKFPPVPTALRHSRRWADRPTAYGENIAYCAGSRTFPWRIAAYAAKDTELPTNNLVYALGGECRIKDISWIKPGLSTWDWWNGFKLYNVDFECGMNTKTHLYHVDFAAQFGVPYITIDEGWYKCPEILNPIPEMDLPKIVEYAASKGVKVVLWSTAGLVDTDLENIFSHYAKMGIAGFKLDFMDAQDQRQVNQIYRIAECAARNHLVIDFHGMYKPTGLSRTYPNVLNYEGVFGLEQIGAKDLDMPLNDVTIPYIRMAAGPMDYTPGAMLTFSRKEAGKFGRGYAQGTRAHQVAAYVVFDQPFGMLCDSPSNYLVEFESAAFMTAIPTVFDKTFIQSGEVGKNIVSVRCKDDKWYVGGLTSTEPSVVRVDFSFLGQGQWKVRYFHDGVNSDRVGVDYKVESITVDNNTVMDIRMAQGGGFAMIIEKVVE